MINCGVVGHSDACLCDVQPIGVQMDPVAVQNMWMGARLAEIQGYDLTDSRDIVSWLSDVVGFHDEFMAKRIPEIQDIPMLVRDPNPAAHWKNIRDLVAMIIANYPIDSAIKAVDHIGVTFDDFIEAMTVSKLTREFTLEQYLAFEADMLEHDPNYSEICRKHNLGRSTVGKFRDLLMPLAVRRNGTGSNPKLVKRDLHDLIMSDTPTEEIISVMKERHGLTYTRAAIYNYRFYHKIRTPE